MVNNRCVKEVELIYGKKKIIIAQYIIIIIIIIIIMQIFSFFSRPLSSCFTNFFPFLYTWKHDRPFLTPKKTLTDIGRENHRSAVQVWKYTASPDFLFHRGVSFICNVFVLILSLCISYLDNSNYGKIIHKKEDPDSITHI